MVVKSKDEFNQNSHLYITSRNNDSLLRQLGNFISDNVFYIHLITLSKLHLTTMNFQLLVVPKVKCPSDRKSYKFDFLWNGHSYGHDLLSVWFGLREDCKKYTHCMKRSFLQKEFEVFDSYGFAPHNYYRNV